MHEFGAASQKRVDTVEKVLQDVITYALEISIIDFGVPRYGGKRDAAEQNELFCKKLSKCDGTDIKSKHQSGLAIDIIAYVNGKYTYAKEYYYMIYQAVMISAKKFNVNIRWGGDWDSDLDLKDQTFNDLCHFELTL